MEVVASDRHNCWSRVADYPRYGCGLDGWRDSLVAATTARAKLMGKAQFYSWLLQYARERVPASELLGVLPDPL
jgi:hypothetical protein